MTLVARHAVLSDIGLHRATNEDSCAVDGPVYVIADGMGGAKAGEVASRAAVETLIERLQAGASPSEAAAEANRRVHALARDDESRKGMGTTLTAMTVSGDAAAVVHIGDSRLYRLRDGRLEQLTSDHSMVGQWLREGTITSEEAAVSRYRSVLTRALGTEPEAEIDSFAVDLEAGDRLLLCSDGLSGLVPDETIAGILGQGPPDVAARELVREAKNRGGYDNITVIVVRFDELESRESAADGAGSAETVPVLPSPARAGDGRDGTSGGPEGAAIASATTPSVMAGVVQAPAAAARSRRRHRLLMVLLVVALAVLVVAVLVITDVVDPASLGIGLLTAAHGATPGVAP